MKGLTIASAGIVAALAAGCGSDADMVRGLQSTTRDSAGVTIVENARPDPDSRLGWHVGEDMFSAQLNVFDDDGSFGRAVTLPDGYHSLLGVMPDGTVLVKPSTVFGLAFGAGPLARKDQDFAFLLPSGEMSVSLGPQPGEEWFVSTAAPAATPHPFGRSTIAAIWGDLAILAPTDRYELRAYTSDGTLARIVRRAHELKRPTQADVDAWIQGRLAELPEERRERYQAQTARSGPEPLDRVRSFGPRVGPGRFACRPRRVRDRGRLHPRSIQRRAVGGAGAALAAGPQSRVASPSAG